MDYEVRIAILDGDETSLADAVPGDVDETLNRPAQFEFVLDPAAALVEPIGYEAHVYRDDTCIFAGPIRTARWDLNSRVVRYSCENGLSYFADRNIDAGADRTNYLVNPEFEDDLDGWTAVNTTATADTDWHVLGVKSARLEQASAHQNAYLHQTVEDFTATGVGSLLTAVGWFHIDPDEWLGEALDRLGLVVSRVAGGVIQASGVFDIDGDIPRGSDQRAEATVWLPPNAVEDIDVRLYSPGGVINWDACSLTLMESLSSVEDVDDFLMDQATIVANIVAFLQDTAYGKDNVAITADCPTTGVERERHYQFADHTPGLEAIVEFTELANGMDISCGPDRVFRTHYRRRGTDRTGTVTLTDGSNCVLQSWAFEGHQAASGVVVLGEGDGPDREEGGASDSSLFGGRTVERVLTPRATVSIDTLDEMATEQLAVLSDPTVVEVEVTEPDLVGLLEPGDTVAADAAVGGLVVDGNWRIMRTVEHPDRSTKTVFLNRWAGE